MASSFFLGIYLLLLFSKFNLGVYGRILYIVPVLSLYLGTTARLYRVSTSPLFYLMLPGVWAS